MGLNRGNIMTENNLQSKLESCLLCLRQAINKGDYDQIIELATEASKLIREVRRSY